MGQRRPLLGEGGFEEDEDDVNSEDWESLEPLPEFPPSPEEEYIEVFQQDDDGDDSFEMHRDESPLADLLNRFQPLLEREVHHAELIQQAGKPQSDVPVVPCIPRTTLDEDDPDTPSSGVSPPVKEIQFSDDSAAARFNSYRPGRKALIYGIAFWIIMFIIVWTLEKAGVPKPDMPSLDDIFEGSLLPNLDVWMMLRNESISSAYASTSRSRPGYQLAQQGAKANYPVVMIPGFVTSGLELWEGKECARKHFRERMWGGVGSARQFLMERDCWKEHLALDPLTGGDPENIRLRPAQGFEAADYFIGNYWVWGKLIENLADVGYDGSSMTIAAYDWRMAFPMLEQRDGYFTKLKHTIEAMHETTGKKAVLISHSMGSQVLIYFFAWVTASTEDGGGGGGKDWVNSHVHTFVNIAGPLLGVVKSTTALLSGEMRDTSLLIGTFGSFVEQFFGRRLRKELWRTWGSLWAMLPTGGDAIWGVGADIVGEKEKDSNDNSFVPLLQLTDESARNPPVNDSAQCEDTKENEYGDEAGLGQLIEDFSRLKSVTVENTVAFLSKWGGGIGSSLASSRVFSFDRNDLPSFRTWHDASRTPLPYAPSMKVFCLYGVGLETERAYFYRKNAAETTPDAYENITKCHNHHYDPPFVMDTRVNEPERMTVHGVRTSDGDGSAPLLSMGYLCADAWRRQNSGLNPSNSEVITREYKHRPEFLVDDPMRSGPYSAEHVDILGNLDMTEDFIRIVTDFGASELKSRYESDIEAIAKKINSHPSGGLFKKRTTFDTFRFVSKVLAGSIM